MNKNTCLHLLYINFIIQCLSFIGIIVITSINHVDWFKEAAVMMSFAIVFKFISKQCITLLFHSSTKLAFPADMISLSFEIMILVMNSFLSWWMNKKADGLVHDLSIPFLVSTIVGTSANLYLIYESNLKTPFIIQSSEQQQQYLEHLI